MLLGLATMLMGWCVAAMADDLEPFIWRGGLTKMDPSRRYNNGLATRAQIIQDDVFICIPRLKEGIEATLLKTCMKPLASSEQAETHCLEPFPVWAPQTEGDCTCLQSVVDLFLDPLETVWALDTGATHVLDPKPVQNCHPKVIGYEADTGQVEKLIDLSSLVCSNSTPQFVVSDYTSEGDCFVYVADAGGDAILVYDVSNDRGHRVQLPPIVIEPNVTKDVLYMVLIRRPTGQNFVYLTYRGGKDLFYIDTWSLQSGNATNRLVNVGPKPGPMIPLGTNDWESIYFRFENKTDVYKWNTGTDFNGKNFHLVHKSKSGLIPTQAMTDYKRGVMRVMECNLVEYLEGGARQPDAVNSLTVMAIP